MTRRKKLDDRVRAWHTVTCKAPGCGKSFQTERESTRYCSSACRLDAFRQRPKTSDETAAGTSVQPDIGNAPSEPPRPSNPILASFPRARMDGESFTFDQDPITHRQWRVLDGWLECEAMVLDGWKRVFKIATPTDLARRLAWLSRL